MNVLVVESPAKAKTINKYLGDGYKVLASFGHIRDLPSKDGSVKPDDDFSMVWEVDARAQSKMKDIASAVKGADKLILATDPDREGEAISWHILQVLRQKHVLGKMPVERVVFNAVTKSAILDAIAHPRQINQELVDAYLARRALDYLVGFTLSPVLWRKLPGSRSAGRVQSVALRLIRSEPGARRRLSRPPRPRLSGRLHPVAGAVAQAAGQPLGRPRAVRGAPPDQIGTRSSSTPISPAAPSTIWSASPCRRCCGASCRAAARQAACSPWRSA